MQAIDLETSRREVEGWLSQRFPEKDTTEYQSKEVKPVKLLTFLCSELQLMAEYARKRFYPVLNVAGDRLIRGPAPLMGDSELQLASLLPMLQDVLDFLEQLESLVSNLLVQVEATCVWEGLGGTKDCLMQTAFRSVGRGLVVLLTIQTMVTLKILPLFFSYRRMLHTMMSKSERVKADLNVLEEVQGQVVHQEESLRMGAFTNFIDAHVKHGIVGQVLRKRRVGNMIEAYVKGTISSICACLNGCDENFWHREDLLGVLLIFVTYCWGGSCPKDRKLLRIVLDVHQKCPILPLFCNLVVNPSRLLMDMLPSSMLSLIPYDYSNQALIQSSVHLNGLISGLESNLSTISFRGSVWSMEVCALLDKGMGDGEMSDFISLIMGGFQLLVFMRRNLETVIQLHVEQLEPMSKSNLANVANYICYQKLLTASVTKCWDHIRKHIKDIQKHYTAKMRVHLESVQDIVTNLEKNAKARRFQTVWRTNKICSELEQCALWLDIGLQALEGDPALPQRLMLEFVLDILRQTNLLPQWVDVHGCQIVSRMEEAEQIVDLLERLVRCEFLYFHPELMRNAFHMVFTNPEEANKLPYLVDGFLDARHLVEQAGFGSASRILENEVSSLLRVHLLDPLSKALEADLFHIVGYTSGAAQSDVKAGNMLPLLRLRPVRLIAKEVSPAQCVTEYLSKTFRKHTLRGSLQWKTLCQLRNIAQEKYGLNVEEIDCAEGTTPTHLDCITSADGLRTFIASRMFNLHSQTFIANPRASSSQVLESLPSMIGIGHFVELIRADVVQVGASAFDALRDASSPMQDGESQSHSCGNGNYGARDVSRGDTESKVPRPPSRGDSRLDGVPRDFESTGGDDLVSALESVRRAVSGSMAASPDGGSYSNDNFQWSFLPKLEGSRPQGSGLSMEALTSARPGSTPSGRVSDLVSIVKTFVVEKMGELRELCSSSETRSVFSQTIQRWHNARKAVGHHYPVAQAELVRKEVIALLKAGTLSLNPLHRLRFHIVDLGKAISIMMSLFHATSRFRESTLAMLPREFTHSNDALCMFLSQIGAPQHVVFMGEEFDAAIDGFERISIVREQYNEMLQSIFMEGNCGELSNSLKYLYILVPALTLDHVESMRSLRGPYQEHGLVTSVTVTDDSFAIGMSFLLEMLGQVQKFAELLWFDSAHKDYHIRLNRLEVGPDTRGHGVNRSRTQNAESQKVERLMESIQGTIDELRLLDHSMTCARLFFQSTSVDDEKKRIQGS